MNNIIEGKEPVLPKEDDNLFESSINFLPHGEGLRVLDKVLYVSKAGHILCIAKSTIPESMLLKSDNGQTSISPTSAIEFIAQASAVGRIIEKRIANQDLKAFGAVMKVRYLKKLTQNIRLDTPLLIYAEFKMVLPNIYEVSGALRDAKTNNDLAVASFNIIEFDK